MLAIALEAAKSVTAMTVEAFQGAGRFDYKPDRSVVTQTDLRVESKLRELFARRTLISPFLAKNLALKAVNHSIRAGLLTLSMVLVLLFMVFRYLAP